MTPRTLKLNAHRSLTYYTPEDVATLQHELSIARQDAELLTGYWKAAVAEIKALRQHIADHKIQISDNQTGDDLADRLVAAWNCSLGAPTQDLLPGHYGSLREREPT